MLELFPKGKGFKEYQTMSLTGIHEAMWDGLIAPDGTCAGIMFRMLDEGILFSTLFFFLITFHRGCIDLLD